MTQHEPSRPTYHPLDSIQTLWITVFGLDGRGGLRQEQEDQRGKIAGLEQRAAEIETVWRVLRWLALAISGLVGMLLSGPLGEAIGKLFK